jgi:hypothetical protein
MPRYDGTGPWGQGPMSGRGMGPCNRGFRGGMGHRFGGGWGGGWGRGWGRSMGMGYWAAAQPATPPADLLAERKRMLEEELKEIEALLAKESDA